MARTIIDLDNLWETPPREMPLWNQEEGKCPHYYIADEVWKFLSQVKVLGYKLKSDYDECDNRNTDLLVENTTLKMRIEKLEKALAYQLNKYNTSEETIIDE